MLACETNKRQQTLNENIYSMSKRMFDMQEIRKVALVMLDLYTGGFRHAYSEFFPIMVNISSESNDYVLEYLSNNIEALRKLVEEDFVNGNKEFVKLYPHLRKLCDHLNLEIGRFNYYSKNEQKIADLEKKSESLHIQLKKASVDLNEAQELASTLQQSLSTATDNLKTATDKAAALQTELVAVLSIFAAIVVGFSGGMNFMGNALASISEANIFKSTFFIIICGMVLFNIIFLLMYLVGKIIGRNIYARCESADCTCGENGKPKCNGVKRIRKRLPYVFWFNVFFAGLFVLNIALWSLRVWVGAKGFV